MLTQALEGAETQIGTAAEGKRCSESSTDIIRRAGATPLLGIVTLGRIPLWITLRLRIPPLLVIGTRRRSVLRLAWRIIRLRLWLGIGVSVKGTRRLVSRAGVLMDSSGVGWRLILEKTL